MTIWYFIIINMVFGTIYPMTLKKKISSVEDLIEIKKYIENDNELLENVGIANYQLIGVRKEKNNV